MAQISQVMSKKERVAVGVADVLGLYEKGATSVEAGFGVGE
jgi:hypothetical protein